jgi:glycine cleavage system regulatory protein
VLSAGGNWLESHLSRLAASIAVGGLVELETSGVEARAQRSQP